MRPAGKEQDQLIVPASVQRWGRYQNGIRLRFKASRRTITITVIEEPSYKPTEAELAAINKGESQIALGPLPSFA